MVTEALSRTLRAVAPHYEAPWGTRGDHDKATIGGKARAVPPAPCLEALSELVPEVEVGGAEQADLGVHPHERLPEGVLVRLRVRVSDYI